MASKAQMKVYRVDFDPNLKALLPLLPWEKRNELFEAAAALVNRIDPIAQGSLGERGITSVWTSISFGRVGLSIINRVIVISFDGFPPEGPDDRPPSLAALAPSELTDALRASAHLYAGLNPAVTPGPGRFMLLASTFDADGFMDLKVASECELKISGVREAAIIRRNAESSGDLDANPNNKRAAIIVPRLLGVVKD